MNSGLIASCDPVFPQDDCSSCYGLRVLMVRIDNELTGTRLASNCTQWPDPVGRARESRVPRTKDDDEGWKLSGRGNMRK